MECVNVYATVENIKALLLLNYKELMEVLEGKKEIKSLSFDSGSIIKPDYIIDCIDNLDAKVELVSKCVS